MRLTLAAFKRAVPDPAKGFTHIRDLGSLRDVFSEAESYSLEIDGPLVRVSYGASTSVYPLADLAVGLAPEPEQPESADRTDLERPAPAPSAQTKRRKRGATEEQSV